MKKIPLRREVVPCFLKWTPTKSRNWIDVNKLLIYFPLLRTGGFKEGVFPGVFLLSLCRLSGFPVESAILFGPGLSAISSKVKL